MKIVSSVDNRAYAIVALDNLQPGEDSAAQLRIGETACAFDIENGRQVAWLQFDMTNEEAGLFLDINIRDEEMICRALRKFSSKRSSTILAPSVALMKTKRKGRFITRALRKRSKSTRF